MKTFWRRMKSGANRYGRTTRRWRLNVSSSRFWRLQGLGVTEARPGVQLDMHRDQAPLQLQARRFSLLLIHLGRQLHGLADENSDIGAWLWNHGAIPGSEYPGLRCRCGN